MTKELWINLPVKDINTSKEFFTKLGFTFNEEYGNSDDSLSLVFGAKKVIVMLFKESVFEKFTRTKTADLSLGSEVLISIDAESREEVDEICDRVEKAGGMIFGKPEEVQGWMYGCGFADPDGHRWNVLHMDFSKLKK